MAQLSQHDRELLDQLRQRFAGYPSHDWKAESGWEGKLFNLNLSELDLTQLPPELWQITSLQSLSLSGNQLSSLPAELGQLTNLEMLRLHGNQLSKEDTH